MMCLLTGCGSNVKEKQTAENNETKQTVDSEEATTLHFMDQITELKKGFSYVKYDKDYGFDAFIDQGGASADSDVFQFLAGNLFAEASGLSFAKEAFGCSTLFVQSEEGEWIFGRNFDWNRCNTLVIKSKPEHGYASITTVNTDFIKQGAGFASAFLSDEMMTIAALYAPLDGMNEEGFCISVNMISDGEVIEQNTDKSDLTTTTAVRLLLNRAATIEEAVALLQEYDLHSSMGMMVHFAMADKTGKSVVVEYIDNEMIVTETPVVTNFYLTEGSKYGIGTEQSHKRYDILMERISDKKMSMSDVSESLDLVSKDNFQDTSTTEWSAVFNLNIGEVIYYHRENYSEGYQFSLED